MMKISTKGQYALLIMTELAQQPEDKFIPLKLLSHRHNLSIKYLEQILIQLSKAGLVVGVRGSNGGYKLVKKTEEYTTGEILRALEGDLSPVNTSHNNVITDIGNDDYWKDFEKVINDYVDSVTLDKLVEKNKENVGWMYYTHTRDITEMGGIMRKMPFLGVGFVLAGFAGLGLPGFSGFIAESTIFIGAFQQDSTLTRIVTILAILSITTTAVYILQTANRMLHGPLPQKYESLTDGCFREKLVIVVLVACLLFIGVCPGWISEILDQSIAPIFEKINNIP